MITQPVIKIVQYHWGKQNRSYDLNQKINAAYCHRHGYEHIVKTFMPREDRAHRWSKIPAMREELHDCDFLLYLDADAFFYSHELRIEEELLPLLEEKQIMMSADWLGEGLGYLSCKPNTGVILVRNTARAAEILRVWDESSERPGFEEFRFHYSHEQEACFRTVWQEYATEVKLLVDYYLMNGTNGVYIRHLQGKTERERLWYQQKFLHIRRNVISV